MGKFVYTKENLRRLQLAELEMLREVDRICRKHEIAYILDGGTLLGAIRHGGFIPWDDDVDLRMLREEYDRFCEVCQTELSPNYFLQTYRTDPGYRWGYARILKNGTVYKRKGQHRMTARNGIFIDIFPDDDLPEGWFSGRLCTGLSWICRKLLYSEVGVWNKRRFSSWFGFFILNLFPKEWGHRGMEYLSRRYHSARATRVRCFGWGSREEERGLWKRWHLETGEVEFEGLTLRASKDIKGFLTHFFGENYMSLPPREKRIPGHMVTDLDFGDGNDS
ncbi:MAG: LicD family protein [Lachnospiraceae bacterium]|nr:LicD family protein [Lachnospiraceae bacterium]